MRNIENIFNSLCTGCSACKNSCPKEAITMQRNVAGYYTPSINHDICVDCGICDNTCPVIEKKPDCYAAWASDEIRRMSSSGGFFSVAANYVLNNGGVVFGAAWTDDIFVKHKYIESVDDLDELRRSKYVQSEIGDSYSQAREFLKAGRKVLFVGTPCQISGLYASLNGKVSTDNLITMDFICYYNPSIYVLRKYLHDNYGLENIASVNFRIKKFGWICAALEINLKNGEQVYINDVNEPYFLGFFNGYYAREACLKCKFSKFPHAADFTLGDFWKIEEHDSTWNDGLGTSMLLANTSKAKQVLRILKPDLKRVEQVPFEWMREGQSNRHTAPRNKQYFNSLLGMKSFNDAIRMAHHSVYDIGMVCVMNYMNYGSAFTNYALYKTLLDLKKSVYIIRQPLDSTIKPADPPNYETFKYPEYAMAPLYENVQAMKELNNHCRQFIVGSDQLFNYAIYKNISGFMKLDWVDDSHAKAVYAASFGINKILGGDQEKESLQRSISRFKYFSVREESAVELVQENFGITPEFVLDPVFICDKKHYKQITAHVKEDNVQIFSYILDPNQETAETIKALAGKLQMSVLSVTDMWRDESDITLCWDLPTKTKYSNEKWLAGLMNSQFVIADSFHATCFAIMFNKPFVVIPNKMRGETRVLSLLRSLGIDVKRVLYDENKNLDIEYLLHSIDYDAVNARIEELKIHSMNYLKRVLGII